MKFGKGTGELKATAQDGKPIDMNQPSADKPSKKIEKLLENTKWDNTDKFGEGDFALRLTIEENGQNKDVKVELVDKSNFNGGKEYVMDSQTIKDGATANGANPKTVTLAGQEIVFKDLANNFVAIQNNGGGQQNDKIKGTVSTTLSYISLASVVKQQDLSKGLTTNIDFYSIDDSTFIDYDNLVSMGVCNL